MERFERPQVLEGKTIRAQSGHGIIYITINWNGHTGLPVEVFARLGKAGGCETAHLEALTRIVSVSLQSGVHPDVLVNQLRQVRCCPYLEGNEALGNTSPADAIAHALMGSYEKEEELNEQ